MSSRQAGLGKVDVANVPEAAGIRLTAALSTPATVLTGGFGGGTSDLSLPRFNIGAARTRRVTPLVTTGVGMAGDAFDAHIINCLASHLGKPTRHPQHDAHCLYILAGAMDVIKAFLQNRSRLHRFERDGQLLLLLHPARLVETA